MNDSKSRGQNLEKTLEQKAGDRAEPEKRAERVGGQVFEDQQLTEKSGGPEENEDGRRDGGGENDRCEPEVGEKGLPEGGSAAERDTDRDVEEGAAREEGRVLQTRVVRVV